MRLFFPTTTIVDPFIFDPSSSLIPSAFGEHITLVGYGGYVSSRAYVHIIQDNNTDARSCSMARILRK